VGSSTLEAIASSPAAIVIIGSFDGSGNFGDVAQFLEQYRMILSTGTSVPVLAIVELRYRDVLERLVKMSPALHAVHYGYFDNPSGNAAPGDMTDLFPLRQLPGRVLFHFSGGGYANRMWARRKAAMYLAARRLVWDAEGSRPYVRLAASGLQMDEDGAIDLAILRETEVLGTRDARSLEVATLMGAKYATFSGDDALGLLLESARHTPTASMSASGVINVHVSTESYVTPNSARRLDVVVDILGRLAQRSEVSQINLIVAFGDERISERDVATQTAAMIGGMTELRRASVDVVDITRRLLSGESVLPAAQFCVSSSYHVALSSIVAEVPTVLMWSGDYYREKAEGLAELFDLPPELLLDDRSDPASAIERCLAIDHSEEERARYAACIRDGIIRSLSGRIEVDRALAQQILALEGGAGWEQVARLSSEYGAAVREVADLRLRVAELTRARRALAGTLD
jgi:hypothetical protein